MNMGYEEEDLKPYIEPVQDWNDRKRIDILETMGYSNSMVEEALKQQKFDDCYASYLLLGRRNTEVSSFRMFWAVNFSVFKTIQKFNFVSPLSNSAPLSIILNWTI